MKKINYQAVIGVTLVLAVLAVVALAATGNLKWPMKEPLEDTQAPTQAPTTSIPMVEEPKAEMDKALTTDELLPKLNQEANDFARENPVAKMLQEQNFLVSGYHVGVNTVLQSNKIPYHDLRSSPAIGKNMISPWLNSSIEAPAGSSTRRLFEIGTA
jgi:hypothetical protein